MTEPEPLSDEDAEKVTQALVDATLGRIDAPALRVDLVGLLVKINAILQPFVDAVRGLHETLYGPNGLLRNREVADDDETNKEE